MIIKEKLQIIASNRYSIAIRISTDMQPMKGTEGFKCLAGDKPN